MDQSKTLKGSAFTVLAALSISLSCNSGAWAKSHHATANSADKTLIAGFPFSKKDDDSESADDKKAEKKRAKELKKGKGDATVSKAKAPAAVQSTTSAKASKTTTTTTVKKEETTPVHSSESSASAASAPAIGTIGDAESPPVFIPDSALISLLKDLSRSLADPEQLEKTQDANQKAVVDMARQVLVKALETPNLKSDRIVDRSTKSGASMSAEAWSSGDIKVSDTCHGSLAVVWGKRENGLLNVTVAGNCANKAPSGKKIGEFIVVLSGRSSVEKGFDIQSQSDAYYWLAKLGDMTVDADCCNSEVAAAGADKVSKTTEPETKELKKNSTIVLQAILTERGRLHLAELQAFEDKKQLLAQKLESDAKTKQIKEEEKSRLEAEAALAQAQAEVEVAKAKADAAAKTVKQRSGNKTEEIAENSDTKSGVAGDDSKVTKKAADDTDSEEKGSEKDADKSAEKSTDKSVTKSADKTVDKSIEKTAEKSASKNGDKSTSKTADKSTDKTADKSTDKNADNSTEKIAEKSIEKSVGMSSEKTVAKPDSSGSAVSPRDGDGKPITTTSSTASSTATTTSSQTKAADNSVVTIDMNKNVNADPNGWSGKPSDTTPAMTDFSRSGPSQWNHDKETRAAQNPTAVTAMASIAGSRSAQPANIGWESPAVPVGPRQPSLTAALVLPEKALAGQYLTAAVLDANKNAETGVELSFNGVSLTTDTKGQATFMVPEDASPGHSLNVSLFARSESNPGLIEVFQPLTTSASQDLPRIDKVSPIVSQHALLTIDGHNFDGQAEHDRVVIDGIYEGKVVASSPVQLRVILPPALRSGGHSLSVSTSALRSNSGFFNLISAEVQTDPKDNKVVVRVLGTTDKVQVHLTNQNPDVIKILRGNDLQVTTTGGENNQTTISIQRLRKGSYRVAADIE